MGVVGKVAALSTWHASQECCRLPLSYLNGVPAPYEGRATRSAPARCPQHNRGKYQFYALKKKGRKRGVERSSSCRYSRWVSKQDECNPHHHSFLHRWLLPHSTFLDLVQQRLGWVAIARPRHGHRKDSFSPLPG